MRELAAPEPLLPDTCQISHVNDDIVGVRSDDMEAQEACRLAADHQPTFHHTLSYLSNHSPYYQIRSSTHPVGARTQRRA
jgi:hypothetical protein